MDPKTYEPPQPPLIAQLPPVQMPLLPQVCLILNLNVHKCVILKILCNCSTSLQVGHRKVVYDYVVYHMKLVLNTFYTF